MFEHLRAALNEKQRDWYRKEFAKYCIAKMTHTPEAHKLLECACEASIEARDWPQVEVCRKKALAMGNVPVYLRAANSHQWDDDQSQEDLIQCAARSLERGEWVPAVEGYKKAGLQPPEPLCRLVGDVLYAIGHVQLADAVYKVRGLMADPEIHKYLSVLPTSPMALPGKTIENGLYAALFQIYQGDWRRIQEQLVRYAYLRNSPESEMALATAASHIF